MYNFKNLGKRLRTLKQQKTQLNEAKRRTVKGRRRKELSEVSKKINRNLKSK